MNLSQMLDVTSDNLANASPSACQSPTGIGIASHFICHDTCHGKGRGMLELKASGLFWAPGPKVSKKSLLLLLREAHEEALQPPCPI